MFGENEKNITAKIKKCQDIGITAICCLYGDCKEEVDSHKTTDSAKIPEQLESIKNAVTTWEKIVIAFQPSSTVFDDNGPDPRIVEQHHAWIRNWIVKNVGQDVAVR